MMGQGILWGSVFFAGTKIYAIRELVFLVVLFSVVFCVATGAVCLVLAIVEGAHLALAWTGSRMMLGKVALALSIASRPTVHAARREHITPRTTNA